MFNVKVYTIKDLLKYFAGLIIIIVILLFITKVVLSKINKEDIEQENKTGFLNYDLTSCIETTSTIIKDTNNPNNNEIKAYKSDLYEDILKTQISLAKDIHEDEIDDTVEDTADEIKENKTQEASNVELAKTSLATEVITNNPIALNYNSQYGNVKIKNQTSHDLTEEMLNPNIEITNKNILLFHTHTCESYTPSENFQYTETGNFRTTDLNYSVARVGTELENQLKSYGHNVIHDTTYHDYPSYNGSYTNSLATVQNILQNNPTDIIFDIHRDAIGSRSDYAPCVKIGDDVCAQIMFVMGSDEGGLWHPNWNQNLKFAIKVQAKAEEMYPGLFKPLTLTKYRYNQHTGKYASIIEVGATGNTMDQCLNSMKYFAKVLDEILK